MTAGVRRRERKIVTVLFCDLGAHADCELGLPHARDVKDERLLAKNA